MMWLARFFLLYSFYIHPTATLLLISVSHRSTSPPSARKSAANHRIKVLQITEFLPQLFSWFMQYKDLIDAKVPYLSKLSPGGPIPHNHGEGFDAALDLLPQQPGGPIPQNMAKTFDGPPTLERSGSERRGGAVSSLFPEGERVGVRGGALFNGKEGRGDFRKSSTKGGYILLISRRVSVPYKGNRRGCKDY